MRGDFSSWNKDRSQNFRGTLHQQGRVLLDRDWNAQTEIFNEWQETAGRDAFGPFVAAVPAEVPESFKVVQATRQGIGTPSFSNFTVKVKEGRVWADGLLVELRDNDVTTGEVIRKATYLNSSASGQRDAVILETWLEELNPFQEPLQLLEPALGGVDTTERVQTAFRFRLYRLGPGENCHSILPALRNKFNEKGRLTAKLSDAKSEDKDCPSDESSGYTGFEHLLYRIEVAETTKAGNWFKWSQFNGGLVGTGDFDQTNRKVILHGNKNAILYSGITSFYLETLERDADLGCWKVTYGAKVSLDSGDLVLPAAGNINEYIGSIPSTGGKKFFRLWNGIERVSEFALTVEKDLPDNVGIKLKFDPEAAGKYTPGDYWTFSVRAGDIGNPTVLLGEKQPEGIFYHRVPLAEINWTSDNVTGAGIEDCREVFQPLTKLKGCCTYRVGDGVHSHGDFTSVQAAINALPEPGGEICILPGNYIENIFLKGRHDVTLRGCGRRSQLVAKSRSGNSVIQVVQCQNIRIESLAIEAGPEDFGISLTGAEKRAGSQSERAYLKNITLSGLFIKASARSAIQAYNAQFLSLVNSAIQMLETGDAGGNYYKAVSLTGDDMLIKDCEIRVVSEKNPDQKDRGLFQARSALGGLQIGGGSERVRIIDNLIAGGAGNGIELGSADLLKDGVSVIGPGYGGLRELGKDGYIYKQKTAEGYIPSAGQPLSDIIIQSNRILDMGQNGIGMTAFFGFPGELDEYINRQGSEFIPEMVSVSDLTIVENRIESCVRGSAQIPENMLRRMGRGGIVLADTERLVIRDNFIIDNGIDFRKPVCGIFVVQAEGVEISRNHIIGPVITEDPDKPLNVKVYGSGPRGGIWINLALAPEAQPTIKLVGGKEVRSMQFSPAVTAATIRENIVSVQLGRSLTLAANGPVSVVNNQFTTCNVEAMNAFELFKILSAKNAKLSGAMVFQLIDVLAGNVIIFDPEALTYSFELLFSKFFVKLPQQVGGRVLAHKLEPRTKIILPPPVIKKTSPVDKTNPEFSKSAQTVIQYDGLSLRLAYDQTGPSFSDSNFLFTNNQCYQDKSTDDDDFSLASILITTLKDVGFNNNQSGCRLTQISLPQFPAISFPMINTYIFGKSSRTSDNRFIETLDRRQQPSSTTLYPPFSAFTFGLLNITTDNIGTHCIKVDESRGVYLDRYNLIEIENIAGDIMQRDGLPPCKQERIKEPGVVPVDPKRAVEMLDDLYAYQLGERAQFQYAKDIIYQRVMENIEKKYGETDPRLQQVAVKRETTAAFVKNALSEYTVAVTPLPEARGGWAVDGFVRTEDEPPGRRRDGCRL